jgi:hypothetical protein
MRLASLATALPRVALIPFFLAFVPTPASAQVPVPLSISGNVARGWIELPGGIGAELTITFETVVGLHAGALEVTATLVNPTDPALLARLPGAVPLLPPPPTGGLGGLLPLPPPPPPPVSIPASFPVLLRVSPTDSSLLAFSGLYTISLYTHNLQLDPAVPLALYKSPDGGTFRDITATEGRGSYRAGGGGGDFSEFLIVVDRRAIDLVIIEKFVALDVLLLEHGTSIPPTVLTSLLQRLLRARSFFDAGATVAAVWEMGAFSRYVAAHSGDEITDVWRANCGGTDVAGLLRSAADTLKFSLDRKAGR